MSNEQTNTVTSKTNKYRNVERKELRENKPFERVNYRIGSAVEKNKMAGQNEESVDTCQHP
jgi:hypothetical protein